MPAGSLFSSRNMWIFWVYQLIKSLKKNKSAGLFAILQEGMAELLSCDNVMPSFSNSEKQSMSLASDLVSFGSKISRQGSALFCSKIRSYCN